MTGPDGRHFRAARAWFGLSRDRVAAGAGLNPATVGAVETDAPRAQPASADRLAAYWARQGVEFILADPGGGVRIYARALRPLGQPAK